MTYWNDKLSVWKKTYPCKILPPAKEEQFRKAYFLEDYAKDLCAFYKHCNGISYEWFSILPLEDSSHIKTTWDSINVANNPSKTRFLDGDRELLHHFLVFAELDANRCAVMDKKEGSIWYEENGELHQTNLSLEEFIDSVLKEVNEL